MTETNCDPYAPNSTNSHGADFWDPWDAMGVHCGGYSAAIDQNAIKVLVGIREKNHSRKIAKHWEMAETEVELFQYLFCSAGWMDYGTSPRGCFPDWGSPFEDISKLIAAWQAYYELQWDEPLPAGIVENDPEKLRNETA